MFCGAAAVNVEADVEHAQVEVDGKLRPGAIRSNTEINGQPCRITMVSDVVACEDLQVYHRVEYADKSITEPVFAPYYVKFDNALYSMQELKQCKRVMDMGTGTGVLSRLWAKNYENLTCIVAVDKVPEAVHNARANTADLNTSARKVEVIQSDLFDPSKFDAFNAARMDAYDRRKGGTPFDAIIFNGPHAYRRYSDKTKSSENALLLAAQKAKYESSMQEGREKLGQRYDAVYDDGMKTATRFFETAEHFLAEDGFLLFTYSDYGEIEDVFECLHKYGWVAVIDSTVYYDQSKHIFHDATIERLPLWYNLKVVRNSRLRRAQSVFYAEPSAPEAEHSAPEPAQATPKAAQAAQNGTPGTRNLLSAGQLVGKFRRAIISLGRLDAHASSPAALRSHGIGNRPGTDSPRRDIGASSVRDDIDFLNKYRETVRRLLSCLFVQLDLLLPPPQSKHWLMGGYALPIWKDGKFDLEYDEVFAHVNETVRAISESERAMMDRFLDSGLPALEIGDICQENIGRVVRYLSQHAELEILEVTKSDPADTAGCKLLFEQSQTVLYELPVPALQNDGLTLTAGDNRWLLAMPEEELKLRVIEELRKFDGYIADDTPNASHPLKQLAMDKDTQSGKETLDSEERKVLRNLWMQFQLMCWNMDGTPATEAIGLEYARFKKVSRPLADKTGSVFLFSSFHPHESAETQQLMLLLEEIMEVANIGLVSCLWARLHRRFALWSAITAIMTRNASHNIGSHVLPKAIVEAIRKRVRELNALPAPKTNCASSEPGMPVVAEQELDGEAAKLMAENRLLRKKLQSITDQHQTLERERNALQGELKVVTALKARMDQYIQQKCDFLAEITTTASLLTTRSAFLYRDVILPFVTNSLLMDNLVASENVRYVNDRKNRLRIHVQMPQNGSGTGVEAITAHFVSQASDGTLEKYEYPFTYPYIGRWSEHLDEPLSIHIGNDKVSDVQISLPGPLGDYALFGFLENIIRNSAKHNLKRLQSKGNSDENLDITLRIEDMDADFYKISVWDNLTQPLEAAHATVDGKRCKTVVEVIQAYLASDLIDPGGKLKRQAWGLGEMRVCAALMSGISDPAEIEANDGVLKAEASKDNTHLVYSFRLMKAKSICALLPDWPEADKAAQAQRELLRKHGIRIVHSPEELKNEVTGRKRINGFEFVLLDLAHAPEMWQDVTALLPSLPFRLLSFGSREEDRKPEDQNVETGAFSSGGSAIQCVEEVFDAAVWIRKTPDAWMRWAWTKWLRRWLPDANSLAVVCLYLDQKDSEAPTGQLMHLAEKFNKRRNGANPVRFKMVSVDDLDKSDFKTSLLRVSAQTRPTYIFFDRHRRVKSKLESALAQVPFTYMFVEKLSPDFTALFAPQLPSKSRLETVWTLPYELAEAGLLRIIVVDERAAEASRGVLVEEEAAQGAARNQMLSETEQVLGHAAFALLDYKYPAKAAGSQHRGSTNGNSEHNGDEAQTSRPSVDMQKWHVSCLAGVFICTRFEITDRDAEGQEQTLPLMDKSGKDSPNMRVNVNVKQGEVVCTLDSLGGGIVLPAPELQADLLIIHQGVLDKAPKKFDANNTEVGQKELLAQLRKRFPFVIVSSGRGVPSNLLQEEKFLPFSLLQANLLGSIVGKYGITRLSMSLTRQRESNL